jgi:hypothetical protein
MIKENKNTMSQNKYNLINLEMPRNYLILSKPKKMHFINPLKILKWNKMNKLPTKMLISSNVYKYKN